MHLLSNGKDTFFSFVTTRGELTNSILNLDKIHCINLTLLCGSISDTDHKHAGIVRRGREKKKTQQAVTSVWIATLFSSGDTFLDVLCWVASRSDCLSGLYHDLVCIKNQAHNRNCHKLTS